MDIINLRRSVRKFSDQLVEPEKVELLLRAGMQAPSAHNQQPWRFLVVRDRNRLNELSTLTAYTKMLTQAQVAIISFIDNSRLVTPGMACVDMAAATQNILLEAVNLGLGACWMGVYSREERVQKIRQIIEVPENLEPFSMIAIGYPQDPNANHFVDRFDPSKVFYEKF